LELETIINEHYDNLNTTDKEIAEFLIRNKSLAKTASLEKIAKASLFSQSSIFRFCKKIGLSGFSQLHYVLQEAESNSTNTPKNIDFLSQTLKSMIWTVNNFKGTKLDELYDVIINAQQIYIYATGWEQQIMAQQLQRNLYLIGQVSFVFPTARGEMNVSKANIDSEDVIIVISYSGMNDSVVEMIEQFKLRGTKIISFTSFHQNKIAQVSDYNLYYDVVSKTIVKYNRSEGFFSNLALLIDLFTMSLSNYMVERKED